MTGPRETGHLPARWSFCRSPCGAIRTPLLPSAAAPTLCLAVRLPLVGSRKRKSPTARSWRGCLHGRAPMTAALSGRGRETLRQKETGSRLVGSRARRAAYKRPRSVARRELMGGTAHARQRGRRPSTRDRTRAARMRVCSRESQSSGLGPARARCWDRTSCACRAAAC